MNFSRRTCWVKRNGFSMLEMLIVLAILGIMATMAISMLLSAKPKAELDQGQEELSFLLNQSRMLSLSEEVSTRVKFDSTGYWYERQDRVTGTWTIATSGGVHKKFPASVTLTGNTFPGQTIVFTPRGTLTVGGTLTLRSTNTQTLTLVGNIATGRFPLGRGNMR